MNIFEFKCELEFFKCLKFESTFESILGLNLKWSLNDLFTAYRLMMGFLRFWLLFIELEF